MARPPRSRVVANLTAVAGNAVTYFALYASGRRFTAPRVRPEPGGRGSHREFSIVGIAQTDLRAGESRSETTSGRSTRSSTSPAGSSRDR